MDIQFVKHIACPPIKDNNQLFASPAGHVFILIKRRTEDGYVLLQSFFEGWLWKENVNTFHSRYRCG